MLRPLVRAVLPLALIVSAAACSKKEEPAASGGSAGGAAAASAAPSAPAPPKLDYPGTPEGATQLLKALLAPEAEGIGLSAALAPTSADYAAVFEGEAAAKAEAGYKAAWEGGAIQVKAKPGQSEIKLFSATTEQLRAKEGEANQFPGGYLGIAEQLKPGVTWYRFKFTEPGNDLGMAYDGLVHVNGHWRLFPKPWRVLAP